MKFACFSKVVAVLLVIVTTNAEVQSQQKVGNTWKSQNSLLIPGALSKARNRKVSTQALASLKFKPTGDLGVAKSLADALGSDIAGKARLKIAFMQLKEGYEKEIAKSRKSNDLAAAMAYFISANVMAYYRAEAPTDAATNALYASLQKSMASIPEIRKMSNAEKQQMHDWLVIMAGFVLTGYLDTKKSGDENGLTTYKELADYSMRLVLGVDGSKISPKNFSITSTQAKSINSSTHSNQIIGVWSMSAASPFGTSPGAVVTNAGYFKARYIFSANGTYQFKSESWGGYLRSNEFWTMEESGIYTASSDSLIITPKTSKRTLRNRNGVVSKTQNNALANITYKWKMHYFEGLNETQLVLQTAKPTARDGAFSSSSQFPKSYLYSSGSNLEWKF